MLNDNLDGRSKSLEHKSHQLQLYCFYIIYCCSIKLFTWQEWETHVYGNSSKKCVRDKYIWCIKSSLRWLEWTQWQFNIHVKRRAERQAISCSHWPLLNFPPPVITRVTPWPAMEPSWKSTGQYPPQFLQILAVMVSGIRHNGCY